MHHYKITHTYNELYVYLNVLAVQVCFNECRSKECVQVLIVDHCSLHGNDH